MGVALQTVKDRKNIKTKCVGQRALSTRNVFSSVTSWELHNKDEIPSLYTLKKGNGLLSFLQKGGMSLHLMLLQKQRNVRPL